MIGQPNLLKRVGIVSVPTLLLAVVTTWLLDTAEVFNPPFFIATVNLSLITVVSVVVALLSAKSYFQTGLLTVRLLGTGVLVYGVGFFVTGIAFGYDTNFTVGTSIAVISSIIAGAFQLVGSSLTWKGIERTDHYRKPRFVITYGGAVAVPFIFFYVFETGIVLAPFSVGGPVYLAGFGLSAILFTISAVMIAAAYRRTKSLVLYWYSLALALIAIGILGLAIIDAVGDLNAWMGAISNYIGCLLFLKAIRSTKNAFEPSH